MIPDRRDMKLAGPISLCSRCPLVERKLRIQIANFQQPTMSYGKKDEDADLALVKADRTQVFQEGSSHLYPIAQTGSSYQFKGLT